MKYNLLILTSLLILGGCVNIPTIEKSQLIKPNQIIGQEAKNPDNQTIVKSNQWWESFDNEQLNNLLKIILENNVDVKVANLNLKKSNEAVSLANANKSFDINLQGSVERQKLSEHGFYPYPLGGSYINFGQLNLQANYNFDLFGKNQAIVNSQIYQSKAQYLNGENIKMGLSIQAVKLYGYWQYLNYEKDSLSNQMKDLTQLLEMVDEKIKIGQGVSEERLPLENNFKTLQSNQLQIKNDMNATLSALTKLAGQTQILSLNADNILEFNSQWKIPNGIDSDVIISKPNIQYYLALIDSQNEKLKSLRADFYPSVSITGQLGLQKIGLSQFLSSQNIFSSFGPSFNLPIFDAGRIKTNYKIGGIDANIFIEQYNQAVINGYGDINDSLYKLKNLRQTMALRNDTLENQKKQWSLSQIKYETGKGSKYSLLQNKLAYEQEDMQHQSVLLNYFNGQIDLISAVGGVIENNK